MKKLWSMCLAVLWVAGMLGCASIDPKVGYTNRSLFDESIKSVEVRIFSTKEFRRGLEFELAEALVRRIEADTTYKVLSGGRADTVLEGQLISVPQTVLASQYSSGLPAEKQQQLRISFIWKDRRSGKILAKSDNLRVVAEYTPPVGETFYTGQQELMNKMARKIVSQMREAW